jgi:hypothetical protein
MISVTNTILISMAISDLLTITLPTPWYVYAFTLGHHTIMEWTPATCFLFEFLLETIPQIFHTATIWLTMTLALHRYIHVCYPGISKRTCSVRKAMLMVMLVTCMAVIHMVPRMLDRFYTVGTIGKLELVFL